MAHYPRSILDAIPLTPVSGTLTPNAQDGTLFTYSGTGSVTLANPTGGTTGQSIVVDLTASGGSLAVTLTGVTGTVTIPSTGKYRAELTYDGTDWWLADGASA